MTKFDCFLTDIVRGAHQNALLADTDTLRVFLTNQQPLKSHAVKADLAEIVNEHGYTPPDVQNAATQDDNGITVVGSDVAVQASGGTVGPFKHVVLYNDTAATKPLIGWWSYAAPVTLQDGETFDVNFGAYLFTVGK